MEQIKDNGQQTTDNGQQTTDNGQRTTDNGQVIDLTQIFHILWDKRRTFFKVWAVTFVLSCIWIFPQPRYYTCAVKLAPEMNGDQSVGGLSSLASTFGFNVGGTENQDAIYPMLYPELFENPEFIVGLYNIHITTKEGDISTDYFTYMTKHQKKNMLTRPYYYVRGTIKSWFAEEDKTPRAAGATGVNPFMMNRSDYDLMYYIMGHISCTVNNKNNVITVSVKDQDPLVCATMADSVKQRLQDFITQYRTSKAKEDVAHYQHLRDSAEIEYYDAMERYSRYCDSHRNVILQTIQSVQDKLQSDMSFKLNSLSAMETQLTEAKVRLQEKTPAFTTLKCATVPVLPAGPKRMMFIICMLFFATVFTSMYLMRKDLKKLIVIKRN